MSRYTAVVMPVLYNTTHSSRKRVSAMIATVWILAFAVSCPLLFGFNTSGETHPHPFAHVRHASVDEMDAQFEMNP